MLHFVPDKMMMTLSVILVQVRTILESCRNEHDDQGGPLTTGGGEVIMEEGEYQAITQMKQVIHECVPQYSMYNHKGWSI